MTRWIRNFVWMVGMLVGAAAAQADLTTNLEGYWPFDGDGEDYSGNRRDLFLSGSPGFGTGLYEQAMVLTGNAAQTANRGGADDEVFDPGGNDFAFQIWVNFSNAAGEQTLIEKFTGGAGPGWTLSKLNTGALQFYATDFNITTGNLGLVNNRWYHMVVTRTGGTVTLYLDNVQIGQMLAAPAIPNTTKRLMIGERDGAQTFPVRGSIDDVAFWSRGLTVQEISDLYNSGTGFHFLPLFVQLEANLEGYWPLDGNGLDFSGNSRSFTIQGTPSFSLGQRNTAIDIAGVAANYADRNGVDDQAFDPGASDFSIQLWFKDTNPSIAGHEVLFEKFADPSGPGYSLLITLGRNIQFSSPNFGVTSLTTLVGQNTWRHIVVTRNGSNMLIYLDGVVVGQTAAASTIPDTNADLTIGRRDGAISASLRGSLDDVVYWSKGLSPIEVKQLYNSGNGNAVITKSPLIICPTDITIECSDPATTNVTGRAQVFNGCAATTASFSDTLVGTPCNQTIQRLWTATDGCTVEQCTQLIHLVDTTSPVLSTPADLSIDCADSTNTTNTGVATATDNCDAPPDVSFADSIATVGCTTSISRVWTAMDVCGNASVATQMILVVDMTAPVLTVPADVTIECSDSTNISFSGTATAIDDCSANVTVSFVDNEVGQCPIVLQRIWSAVDDCGNTSVATQSIFRVDTTDPIIACPPDIVVECGTGHKPGQTGWATATDNCDGSVRISFDDTVSGDACTGMVMRVWTATDDCGNTAVCTQMVTLVDTTLPVGAIVPATWQQLGLNLDGIAAADGFGNTLSMSTDGQRMVIGSTGGGGRANAYELVGTNWVQMGASIMPEIPGAVVLTLSMSADGSRIALGEPNNNSQGGAVGAVRIIEWNGTAWVQVGNTFYGQLDSEGFGLAVAISANGTRVVAGAPRNSINSSHPGQVRVYDLVDGRWGQTGDTLVGPTPDSLFGSTVAISADGSRIVAGAPAYEAPGSVIRVGMTRAYELIGGAWTQMGSDFVGTRQDDSLGTAVGLSSDGRRLAIASDQGGGLRDASVMVHEWSGAAWTLLGEGIYDDSGNNYRAARSIALSSDGCRVSIGYPVKNAPNLGGVRVLELKEGAWTAIGGLVQDTVDNFFFGSALAMSGDGQRFMASRTHINNVAGQVQVFELGADGSTPFVCPSDVVLECGASTNVVDTGIAIAADSCDTNLVISFTDSIANICPTVITRTWTATDACGNAVSCDQTITLEDTTLPILVCPADITIECGVSTLPAEVGEATASDGCDPSVSVTFSDSEVGDSCSRTITRTWTATDACGNATNCVQTITVVDTTAPGGPLVSGGWMQVGADLVGVAGDRFGTSVAMSADGQRFAAAGDFNGDGGVKAGIVRAYESVGGNWVRLGGDILGEAARDEAGRNSIAMNHAGTRIAVGAHLNDGNGGRSGHVRLFDLVGNTWTQVGGDIDGRSSGSESGWAVDLSADGNRVVIGAFSASPGYVQVFELISNTWVQVGSDLDGIAANEGFGSAVSISADGNRIAASAPSNAGGGTSRGQVRIYDLIGSVWTRVGSDIDGEADSDLSGSAVELSADGSRIAIGASGNDGNGGSSGHVRVYELSGNAWTQLGGDIDGESGGDSSGFSLGLAAAGDVVAVGAFVNSDAGSFAGHVRVFGFEGSGWSQIEMDIDGEPGSFGGYAVALSQDGSRLVNGARNYNSNTGLVRVYGLGGLVAGPFCPDSVTVTNSFAPGSKAVFFDVQVEDVCDANPMVVCTPASGATFPEGTTTVSCVASDLCGNSTTCSFEVVVIQLPFTDTDTDNIDDDYELAVFTNLTTVGVGTDFDGDGQSDADEYRAGTDPKDPGSKLEVVTEEPAATAASLTWTTVPGKTYNVEYLLNLPSNAWTPIALNVKGGTFTDTDAGRLASGQGYYRVVVVP